VSSFISSRFIPVKIHIKEQGETFQRFNVQWTPVLAVMDRDGKEQHRWEGYLPPEDFLGQLRLGLAKSTFASGQWSEAASQFDEIAREHPRADFAPLAVYYAGVARYKGGDQGALAATAQALEQRYPASSWATKASVWKPSQEEQPASPS
jgi:hypothetical protein